MSQARRSAVSSRFSEGRRSWCASVRAVLARYDMLDTWRSGVVPADTTFEQWDRHCRTVTLEHELSEWRHSVRSASTLRNLYARIKEYPHTEAFADDPLNK